MNEAFKCLHWYKIGTVCTKIGTKDAQLIPILIP